MKSAPVHGTCDARFAPVRDAFAENFAEEDEVGAGVAVFLDGRCVAELWGGFIDRETRRPWQRDTLVNAYSVGKGVTAMLALGLVEEGALALDAPVAERWPEFGCAGKQAATLRHCLSHRAGLPAIRERLPAEDAFDWHRVVDGLAATRPFWEPGSDHGYHVNTYGFLVGELVCRATGRRFGEALRERLTGALEADYWIGLPASEHGRVAPIDSPAARWTVNPDQVEADVLNMNGDPEHDLMIKHAYFNPPGLSGTGTVNTAAWREAEVPSTNGHGTALGVARLYDAFVRGTLPGKGVGPGLSEEARRIHSDGEDRVLGRPSRFGLGFQLAQPARPLGPSPRAFGHYGYGGSLGFADPEAQLAFAYLMNRPGDRWQTPRSGRLVDAVYGCL